MENTLFIIYCVVFYGEIVGKKRGNFKRINAYFNDYIRTLKKARRLGNYCIYTVNTYLLALAIILVEMRGVEPLSRSVAI